MLNVAKMGEKGDSFIHLLFEEVKLWFVIHKYLIVYLETVLVDYAELNSGNGTVLNAVLEMVVSRFLFKTLDITTMILHLGGFHI